MKFILFLLSIGSINFFSWCQSPGKIVFDSLLNKPVLVWENSDLYIGTFNKLLTTKGYDSTAIPEGYGTFKSINSGVYTGFINKEKSQVMAH